MVTFRVVLVLVAFVILFILGWQNTQSTATVQVFWQTFYEVPIAFVMLYSFAFGALCVGIFTIVSEIRLRRKLHNHRVEIEALTEELRTLRNAPLEILSSSNERIASENSATDSEELKGK
ncbi:MAG: LapA family protein [bacterium]